MTETQLQKFEKQQYMSIETKRKDGTVNRTPVWFLLEGNDLYFQTENNSGKVKRIRNFPQVRVAPCTVDGKLLGEWSQGEAYFVKETRAKEINKMYSKKYGLMKKAFDLAGMLRKGKMVTLAVRLTE